MPCRACGQNSLVSIFSVDEHEIEKCPACGFAQVSCLPDETALHEIYSAEYFDKGKYVDDYADKQEYLRRSTYLENACREKGARLLDYGCAVGAFVTKSNGRFESYGTDASNEAIAICRQSHANLAHRFLDLSDLDNRYEGYFQLVTMWDVIEHLSNPSEQLQEVKQLLAPGGKLILSTPNFSSIWSRLLGSRWAFMTPPEHLGFFSPNSMKNFLDLHGFEIEHLSTKGKFTNFGFLLYKLNRKVRSPLLRKVVELVKGTLLGRLPIYVFGGDILYVVATKKCET